MVTEFDNGYHPAASMDVLKALRWGIRAWELDVSAQTISNCFKKALTNKDLDHGIQPLIDKISSGLKAKALCSRSNEHQEFPKP